MAFRDTNLSFTKSNDWDLGADLPSDDSVFAPDAITLPSDTVTWDDIGAGQQLYVAIHVVEKFESGGAPTVRFDVGVSTENGATGFYRVGETKSFTVAEMNSTVTAADPTGTDSVGLLTNGGVANAILIPLRPIELDVDGSPHGKFLALKADNGVAATLTQGKVRAWLTIGQDTSVQPTKHYHRSGFTVA